MEEEIKKLSKTIVQYSLNVKKNERVLIESGIEAKPLILELVKEITSVKGVPIVRIQDSLIQAELLKNIKRVGIKEIASQKKYDVKHFDCFIKIRTTHNDFEGKDIPSKTIGKIGKLTSKSDDIRINQRRWVLLNYPTNLDAFKAKMPTLKFQEYAFRVMNVDYKKMCEKANVLKKIMERTDQVHMIGPNTDITFSIKGIPAVPCCGNSNIPDGEVYTAPVKDSVNGTITFNTPCPYQGKVFTGVSLTFQNGKIIKATCNENEKELNEIFDIDEGARYIGEFSFGLNPEVKEPMGDILYDEKIIGSIHFTPGRCYKDAYNGNDSVIHWDMVWIQRSDYGGGEVYFDDVLVRKNGKFVLSELQDLNYE